MEKKVYVLNEYKGSRPKHYDDFYGWANFDWLISNKIPYDETKYTHFIQAQDDVNIKLKKILETNKSPQVTTLYKSYLDYDYKNSKCLVSSYFAG